jgi:murein DD-endopeptidase MepM/ murein hydrolase activator NlpD
MRTEDPVKKVKMSMVLVIVFLLSLISIAMVIHFPGQQGGNDSQVDVIAWQAYLNEYQNNSFIGSRILGPATSSSLQTLQSENPPVAGEIVVAPTGSELSNAAATYTVNAAAENGGTITPSVSQPVLKVISVSRGENITNFWQSRSTWLQPLKGLETADPTGGARYFGAPRANGRAHAAIDFIAPDGTLVYAMTDGQVTRISLFFENTSAVEVQNTDGTVARYGEIAPLVSVGTIVHRGDVIGKIITNYAGTSMLHLEMYKGTASGSLSQTSNDSNYSYVTVRNYERRSDLIDPTGAKDLPLK